MTKRILTTLSMAFVALLAVFLLASPAEAAEVTASGTCGDDLTWELTDDGILTISGSGAMANYTNSNRAPWYTYRGDVQSVVIENGVTSIGKYAFYVSVSLTSITIPDSVTSIGDLAFYNCTSLKNITIPDSVMSIGDYAFAYCDSLTTITFEGSTPPAIGSTAFYHVTATVYDPDTEAWINSVRQDYGGTLTWFIRARGTCGDNLTWVLTGYGTLTISGTGAMTNYTASNKVPWYTYSEDVQSVVIENGVTTVGNYAFCACSIGSITIPDSVTSIGNHAFYSCIYLGDITISDSVTSIGSSAFRECWALSDITIPNSVTSIGSSAFYNCPLKSVTIPDSMTSIGDYTFEYCYSLTSITIPDSVTSIGNGAFLACDSLTSITIPDSVTNIGSSAFCDCWALSDITIPDSVTSIGDRAFYCCTSLTSITIPDSVTSIGAYAFDECGISFEVVNGVSYLDGWVIDCDTSITSAVIKENTFGIAGSAFASCSSLTSITIPDSVTSIGDSAFFYCKSLTSITIPDSVTSIGDSAFERCSSLVNILVHADNKCFADIDGVLFTKNYQVLICYPAGNELYSTYVIPDSVTSISSSAFSYCSSLTSITIPDSVTSIGDYAFYKCGSLTSITIPDGVTSIGNYAFCECTSLRSITIPDSVTSIGNYAFAYCKSLTSITIPDGVTSIGDHAFYKCGSLTSITIPDGVTSIGGRTFSNCTSLKSITVPDSVTSIGYEAFYCCTSLTSITIPDGVTSIGGYAFYGCTSLTSITIPDSVTSIGNYAFYNCWSLTSVTFEGSTPPTIGSEAFDYVTATVYYPNTDAWTEDVRQNYGGTLTWVAVEINPTIESSALTLSNILQLDISVKVGTSSADEISLHVTVGDDEDYTVISDYASSGVYLVYTLLLPAHRLYERVTLELVCNGEIVDSEIWTAEAYFAALKESNSDDEELLELLDRLSDYGKYAAWYAKQSGEAPDSEAVGAVDKSHLEGHAGKVSKTHAALKAVVSLYIDDACGLRFKFDAAAWEGCTLYIGGVAVEVTEVGSQVVYEIADLIPQDWGTAYNVQVTDSEGAILLDMDYSVMSYGYARLSRDTEARTGLNGLLKAMYLYHKAAETYAA